MANEEQLRIENEALKEQVKKLFKMGLKSEIRDSLIAEGSSSDVLVPHIMQQIKITETNGAYSHEVINKDTNVGRVNSKGKPMTIRELVQEMKTQESFVTFFDDAEILKTKTVKIEDITRDRTKPEVDLHDIAEGRVEVDWQPKDEDAPADAIPISNQREIGKNLESIADGKTQVDMKN